MTPGDSRSVPNDKFDDETEFHLPEDHWPLPELTLTSAPPPEPSTADFVAVEKTTEYQQLRKTFRTFAFPMTVAGLVSYFTFVLMSIYAVDFMARPLFGSLSIGMTIGLLQFAVVYAWTFFYVNFANKRLDPVSGALKSKLEKGASA